MSAPVNSSAPVRAVKGAPGKAGAWVQAHKKPLAIGAAAAAVGLLALYERSKSATGATGATSTLPAAVPNSIARWDALEAANVRLRNELRDAKKPHGQRKPPPVPRPGANRYTIVHGDTLARVAAKVYGVDTVAALSLIRLANPVLAGFTRNASLDHYAGHTIRIPPLPGKDRHNPHPKEPHPHHPRHPRNPHPKHPHARPPGKRRRGHNPHPHEHPAQHAHTPKRRPGIPGRRRKPPPPPRPKHHGMGG